MTKLCPTWDKVLLTTASRVTKAGPALRVQRVSYKSPLRNEPFEPGHRFLEILHVGRVGAADEAFAAFAESGARHRGHLFLVQQLHRKVLRLQAKLRHAGKRVERAERTMTFNAHVFEGGSDEIPAAAIFIHHFTNI